MIQQDAKIAQGLITAIRPELPMDDNNDVFYIGEKELVNAIETTNHILSSFNRKIEFSIHEKTGDIMIKILDTSTNEVIREIPPEKIKDMIANMLERAGLLVDKRA
ncbi:MAG TPA: flagellar protein FlaG [Clostridiales bacterium]|nr:flagellar protein FlaG [Clostridiales bacterium]